MHIDEKGSTPGISTEPRTNATSDVATKAAGGGGGIAPPANNFAEKAWLPADLVDRDRADVPVVQDEESRLTDEETYPEGGLRAWLCVFGCMFSTLSM